MNTHDITWLGLIIGSLIILFPIWIFNHYRTKLIKPTIISVVRMAFQLFLVGIYLELIFEYNSIWINLLWVFIMIFAASFTIITRSDLTLRHMFVPLITAILTNVLINGLIYSFLIVGTDTIFSARYLIPIMGMVVGNSVNSSIIGIRKFYSSIYEQNEQYIYKLMCGANRREATFDYYRDAIIEAFNPVIASTATIGLIWLPGMMTGQILGGSNPAVAIKYQIIIVISIFAGSVITVFTALKLSERFAFNKRDLLDSKIFKKVSS